eukprot:CAMPEP_0119260846 /NCGR_PEP_ID=MMETSP1329-20130426/1093_1 /TAXON_ID=114041 /ORGANISM="Genus nov. species nov., Strain RCC1024" /LENGTH=341 /DNA_ID=CAMNT_0007260315 /DNA_START=128 /DNA_END=1153 /DNA_ORIENTATION=-
MAASMAKTSLWLPGLCLAFAISRCAASIEFLPIVTYGDETPTLAQDAHFGEEPPRAVDEASDKLKLVGLSWARSLRGTRRKKRIAAEEALAGEDAGEEAKPPCDAKTCALRDFEVWRREEGFWYGEYTFLGADGNPFKSANWNYPYDHYYGFIHLELDGNKLKQRNVFVYPPQTKEKCEQDDSVVGTGACGFHGNEKIFGADQEASDCDGNLAGPYEMGGFVLDTTTKVLGDDTVVYSVKLPEEFGGGFTQNQLTTLPGNGVRVRTAQGFAFEGQPSYASFYRETKLDQDAWLEKLREVREANNVLESDHCAWKTGAGTTDPSGVTCEEHFMRGTLGFARA